MNIKRLLIAAVIIVVLTVILTEFAILVAFEISSSKSTHEYFEPYFVIEKNPGAHYSDDDVPFIIEHNASSGEWLFRDADDWNVIRKDYKFNYLLSEKMPAFVPIEEVDYSEIDIANNTKIPELNYTFNFRADDATLRYDLYFRNGMNVECIEAFSNIRYNLSRKIVSANLTRREIDKIPEELIYSRNKTVRIADLPDHTSTCIEDSYSLPIPKLNEIYYLRIYYKEIYSVDVPGRTIFIHNYDTLINETYTMKPAVFVIKDSRTRFDSPYDEYTANLLKYMKESNTKLCCSYE
ncbi:hypothetical protein [Methanomicrobium mobile]|jgi:hypothetical protein|uniref:hypothetical protein n=1 Tax=Methanomicrobium mobile TaxID=2205 RepID=UPI0005B2E329|nr:hypothetical protein [Methanomicrobium mobile]